MDLNTNICYIVFDDYKIHPAKVTDLKYFDSWDLVQFKAIFDNQKEAKRYSIKCQLQEIASQLSKEENENIDWVDSPEQKKHSIYYNYKTNTLERTYTESYRYDEVYSVKGHKFLERAIEKIGEENLIAYFKGE